MTSEKKSEKPAAYKFWQSELLMEDVPDNKKIKDYFEEKGLDHFVDSEKRNSVKNIKLFSRRGYFDIVHTTYCAIKLKNYETSDEIGIGICYALPFREGYPINKELSITYFGWGASYISKDGEYRPNIIYFRSFEHLLNNEIYRTILDKIDVYLHERNIRRKRVLIREIFYPTEDTKNSASMLEIAVQEFQSKIYCFSWLDFFYKYDKNILENHMNEKYQEMFLQHKEEDLAFYKKLLNQHGETVATIVKIISSHKMRNVTKLGQKIIPLSISEAQNPFDIRYKQWREFFISVKLSNLVGSFIVNGFPMTTQWFYIKNSRKGLFDNPVQYDRMERSEIAQQMVELLNRATIYSHGSNEIRKKDNISWISDKFRTFTEKINEPVDYAKKEIIMSNVALSIISEYVGNTFMDVIQLSKQSKDYHTSMESLFNQKSFYVFKKIIFDLCYNLLCMTKVAGVIHGDLHLNNATIKRCKRNIKGTQTLYVIGEEDKDNFILENSGLQSYVIDFSRSIIATDKIESFHDPSIPKSYDIVSNKKKFHKEQVLRLIGIYNKCIDTPVLEEDMFYLFNKNYDTIFKILSASDIYGFSKKLLSIFSIKEIIKPNKQHIQLLEKIYKESQNIITENMNRFIQGSLTEQEVDDMEHPIVTLIHRVFYENNIENVKMDNVKTIYNINRPSNYSLTLPKTHHPLLGELKERKKGKLVKYYGKEQVRYDKQVLFKKNIKNNQKNLKVVNYIALRQKEKHG